MKLLTLMRALFVLLLVPLVTLCVSVATILLILCFRFPYVQVRWVPRWWGRIILQAAGVKVLVEGENKLLANQPYIFVANHQSQFDIPALHGYFYPDFRWLAKKELFNIPIFGKAMLAAGFIPIDRSHGRKAMRSLGQAAERIASGTSVIIFPEGTRSPDGKLLPFKSGAMHLAIKAGVPLVPMAIIGTHSVLPKGKLLSHPGTVWIRLGNPIAPSIYRAKQKQELAKYLNDAIVDLMEDNEPPDPKIK